MREIIFKNLTTRNRKRRDLWMQEITDENGLHAEIQKRCMFHVRHREHFPDPTAVKHWVDTHTEDPRCRLRNLTVTRRENTKTGAKHFFFKAIGNFYAVMGEEVFLVGFVQTYEVNLEASSMGGSGEWT